METQYLRSNLGDGTIPPQATVDDQMRALTRAFRETEAKYKLEAEETAKDLLRLTGELNKRDRAYTQLKQFCDDQEVLKDTMKAQQQAELQRSHERRVEAMKLVETTENEKNKVLEELENIKATNNSITDSARDDLVRHKAEMEESQASFDRQKNVLNDCQLEVGKLESECKKMANSLEENNKIMESLKVENDQFESERLAAVAELRASELCREQEAAAHQKRLDDIKAQAEEIESLKAQLKTSNSNAIYMEQRGN
jgi:chromosome segregation ATPase